MANIDVYSNMKKIGALQKEQEKHLFAYALDSNTALSLTMPIRLESYAYGDLHPFFQINRAKHLTKKWRCAFKKLWCALPRLTRL